MAVEGVNNNNASGYALSAALIGGGAGAVIGHATKSILKDNNFSDEFVKETSKVALNSEKGKAVLDMCKVDPKANNYATQIIEVIKKHSKVFGIDPKEISKSDEGIIEFLGGSNKVRNMFSEALDELKSVYGVELKLGKDTNVKELIEKYMADDLEDIYDMSKKDFKAVADKDKPLLEYAKKAQRNLKLKAAGIYGAVGAAVLGLGTYFLMNSKSNDTKSIDAQA